MNSYSEELIISNYVEEVRALIRISAAAAVCAYASGSSRFYLGVALLP